MSVFRNFFGNVPIQQALLNMIRTDRIPQTILLGGPEGVGKATLVRRFAAQVLGDAEKIERDDLSLPDNVELLAEREKLPSDKRADDPLVFKKLIYEMRFDEVSAVYAGFGQFFVGLRFASEDLGNFMSGHLPCWQGPAK